MTKKNELELPSEETVLRRMLATPPSPKVALPKVPKSKGRQKAAQPQACDDELRNLDLMPRPD